jgi:hypothetical protein
LRRSGGFEYPATSVPFSNFDPYFDASAKVRDGSRYHNTYTWYLRMQQGHIVEAVAFVDSTEFNDFRARVEPA